MPEFDNIQMPSVDLNIELDGKYDHLVSVSQFGKTFRLCGGINLPKIITCVGSDGKQRTQLVKVDSSLCLFFFLFFFTYQELSL